MSHIILENVCIDFPILNRDAFSIKRSLFNSLNNKKKALIENTMSGDSYRALHNISLEINKDERVGLVGLNGAGKTSLMRVISGIYPPTTGQVHVSGKVYPLLSLNAGFEPDMTGLENVHQRAILLGMSPAEIKEKLPSILDFADIGSFIHLPVRAYSAGMSLRLAYAVSTSITPDILVLDEVINAGDNAFQKKCRGRMQEMIAQGSIVVITTHAERLINEFCDRVIWLDKGHIKLDGPTAEVMPAYSEFIMQSASSPHKKEVP